MGTRNGMGRPQTHRWGEQTDTKEHLMYGSTHVGLQEPAEVTYANRSQNNGYF